MDQQSDHDLLIEIKGELKNLNTKIDGYKDLYSANFIAHDKAIVQNASDTQKAWNKVHNLENDLVKIDENANSLSERVSSMEQHIEKLELTIQHMRDTLIKVSVISTLITAGLTAIVVEFFSKVG